MNEKLKIIEKVRNWDLKQQKKEKKINDINKILLAKKKNQGNFFMQIKNWVFNKKQKKKCEHEHGKEMELSDQLVEYLEMTHEEAANIKKAKYMWLRVKSKRLVIKMMANLSLE